MDLQNNMKDQIFDVIERYVIPTIVGAALLCYVEINGGSKVYQDKEQEKAQIARRCGDSVGAAFHDTLGYADRIGLDLLILASPAFQTRIPKRKRPTIR
jgi:hypothetical protein